MISFAKENEEFESMYLDSVEVFDQKFQDFKQQEKLLHEQRLQEQQSKERESQQKIKSILSSGEILGEKISPIQSTEIEHALNVPDRTVDVQGNRYRATEMMQFLLEFQQSEELKLYAFKKWKYRGQELESIKKKVKEEIDNELASAMKSKVIKNRKAIKKRKIKEQLDKEDKNLEKESESRNVMTLEI